MSEDFTHHCRQLKMGGYAQVEALDLNPGVARIDPKTRKEFLEFKTKKKEGCAPHPSTPFIHCLGASCVRPGCCVQTCSEKHVLLSVDRH